MFFVDRNYYYKPVATQIPHDAGLAMVRLTGDQIRDNISIAVGSLIILGE